MKNSHSFLIYYVKNNVFDITNSPNELQIVAITEREILAPFTALS